jgi:hypothetical protein
MSTPAPVYAWFEHEKTRVALKSKDGKRMLDLTIYDAFEEHDGLDLEFVEGENKLGPASCSRCSIRLQS